MALVDHIPYGSQQTFHGNLSYAMRSSSLAFASGQSSKPYGIESAYHSDALSPRRTECCSESIKQTDASSIDDCLMESDNTLLKANNYSAACLSFDADPPLKSHRKHIRKRLRLALGHVQNLISRLEARELDLRSFSSLDKDGFLPSSVSELKQTQDGHLGMVEAKAKGFKRALLLDSDLAKLKRIKSESDVDKLSGIMKQCVTVLKKLRNHKHSWVFNEPVDFVALEIPDYPMIIKHPMDLGTIERKLDNHEYESPVAFAADVRLTFANAMEYNPKGHEVHTMAASLLKNFEERWKVIGKKFKHINYENKGVSNIQVKSPQCCQSDACSEGSHILLQSCKQNDEKTCMRPMSHEEKQTLTLMLENLQMDKIDEVMLIIRRKNPDVKTVDGEVSIDIDSLDEDSLWELHNLLNQPAASKSDDYKSVEPVCEEDNKPSVERFQPSLSLSNGGTVCKENNHLGEEANLGDLTRTNCGSVNEEVAITGQTGERSQKAERDLPPSHISEKSLRAALLKNRFADTILKAREKTQADSKKNGTSDPEIARREKEELERIQREEKAKLQAEAKIAENARRRVEAEVIAKARLEREAERQAARLLLLEMEKSASVDENGDFLKDLEMLGKGTAECHSSHFEDGLGGFDFSCDNPLERLGLFIKKIDEEEEDALDTIRVKEDNADQNERSELDD